MKRIILYLATIFLGVQAALSVRSYILWKTYDDTPRLHLRELSKSVLRDIPGGRVRSYRVEDKHPKIAWEFQGCLESGLVKYHFIRIVDEFIEGFNNDPILVKMTGKPISPDDVYLQLSSTEDRCNLSYPTTQMHYMGFDDLKSKVFTSFSVNNIPYDGPIIPYDTFKKVSSKKYTSLLNQRAEDTRSGKIKRSALIDKTDIYSE